MCSGSTPAMSIVRFVLNNGVFSDDPFLIKRAKQIFNVDILFGVILPPVIWLSFWQKNGIDCWYCNWMILAISIFFLSFVFLMRLGYYHLCTWITILICLLTPVLNLGLDRIFLNTFHLVALSLNGFIYFPHRRRWGAVVFGVFMLVVLIMSFSTTHLWFDEIVEGVDPSFLWGSVRMFILILVYRVASLLIIYWSALEQQRAGESKLTALINSSNDSIWSVDQEFRLTNGNEAFFRIARQMFGIEFKEGQNLSKIALPKTVDEFFRPFYQRAFNGEYIEQEQARYEVNGKPFYALISFSPMKDQKGQVIGCSAYAKNITDLKKTEKALRKSEVRYRGIFENSLVGMVVMKDNRIIEVNQAICEMVGYTPEEMFALGPMDVVAPYNQEEYEEKVMDMFQRKIDGFTIEKAFLRKDGSLLYCWLSQQAYFTLRGRTGLHHFVRCRSNGKQNAGRCDP